MIWEWLGGFNVVEGVKCLYTCNLEILFVNDKLRGSFLYQGCPEQSGGERHVKAQ